MVLTCHQNDEKNKVTFRPYLEQVSVYFRRFEVYIYKLKIDDSFQFLPVLFLVDRYTAILEDLKKDPESHGGPPDCIVSSTILS